MKVCLITATYHPYTHGGLESYALELVERLRARGHKVDVITRGERTAHLPDDGHGEIHQIRRRAFRQFLDVDRRLPGWMATHLEELFSTQGSRAAREIIRRIKPDVVFSHGLYGFGRNMPQTLAGLGIPWLHFVHSYALICKGQTAMDRKGHPCARQCADCAFITRFKNGSSPLRDAIAIYNSAHMRNSHEAAGIVARETHIIDPVFSYKAPEVSATYSPGRPIRLAYVGRVSSEKGIELLCDAVEAEPLSYRLDVIGAGPLLAKLERKHRGAPILFHGHVTPERRDELLTKSDALVAPSLWNEPYGRVIQEGFLAGIPVIAADVGAMAGMVQDGVDGIVFRWRAGVELESLAGALAKAGMALPALREGALETRKRLMGRDNFAFIEELLERAAGKAVAAATAGGGSL
jgi:glycosyltransferase involved in cell wall biosynthesis